MKFSIILTFILIFGIVLPITLSKPSKAENKDGLWSQITTEVDGYRIRRVYDSGNHVICYVASEMKTFPQPAISCIKL